MALEAVVYPQSQDPFLSYGIKDIYNYNFLLDADFNLENEEEDQSSISSTFLDKQTQNYLYGDLSNSNNCSSTSHMNEVVVHDVSNSNPSSETNSTSIPSPPPKKRRAKTRKNEQEIENQRMTHIAVERNRRKQMNHYLSLLRSLMPESYVQRVDQASIVGSAINFVKDLEQKLQFLSVLQKEKEEKSSDTVANATNKMPFSEFFTFPQYSTSASGCENSEKKGEVQSSIADIEVTLVESHASLKIRSKRRPKQLLKMVSSFHEMPLTILHLNVTTTGEIVFYSLSVKVDDDCKLGTVDEIAAAVHQMLNKIQQESILS